jgi:hypothetical protein
MFCNRRSLVAAKKEKEKKGLVHGWVLSENVWERGVRGSGVG